MSTLLRAASRGRVAGTPLFRRLCVSSPSYLLPLTQRSLARGRVDFLADCSAERLRRISCQLRRMSTAGGTSAGSTNQGSAGGQHEEGKRQEQQQAEEEEYYVDEPFAAKASRCASSPRALSLLLR